MELPGRNLKAPLQKIIDGLVAEGNPTAAIE